MVRKFVAGLSLLSVGLGVGIAAGASGAQLPTQPTRATVDVSDVGDTWNVRVQVTEQVMMDAVAAALTAAESDGDLRVTPIQVEFGAVDSSLCKVRTWDTYAPTVIMECLVKK